LSAALTLTALSCIRGDRILFTGLDLSLEPGGAALVTGPNGAGKTSLLRLIAGLLLAHAGEVSTSGTMAFLAEHSALDHEVPLKQALGYWARLDGQDTAQVDRALDAMALNPLVDVPVRMLSTGQLKRAALARIIISDSDIWLLDEPANGLDTESRARLESAIRDHRAAGGIVMVATHQALDLPGAVPVSIGEPA